MLDDVDEFFGNQDEDEIHLSMMGNEPYENDGAEHTLLHKRKDGLEEGEIRSRQEQFRNMGYLEAFDQAKEEDLQKGFEDGYKQHFDIAMKLGEALGEVISPVRRAKESSDANKRVKQLVKEVRSFLVNVDKQDDNDATSATDALETLVQELREHVLLKDDNDDGKRNES